MSSLTAEQQQSIKEFANSVNEAIKTVQNEGIQEYISKNGEFIKDFSLQKDPDAEEMFYFYKEFRERHFFISIGEANTDWIDNIRPYEATDNQVQKKAKTFEYGLLGHYLPFLLTKICHDIDIKISSTRSEEYKKSLQDLKDSIDEIIEHVKKKHKKIPMIFRKVSSYLDEISDLNVFEPKDTFESTASEKKEELHKKVKDLNQFYDKLYKKMGKYQNSIKSIKPLSI